MGQRGDGLNHQFDNDLKVIGILKADCLTPINEANIVNKKYVDDNIGGAVEGTAVLSTGELGASKFLREDGDGTCSWQAAAGGGIRLDEVNNPNANKDFSMGNNELMFSFTGPTGANGAFGIEASAGFSGDLVHIHQHTGNPGAVDLVHLEASDADVVPLRIVGAGTYDMIAGAISVGDIVTSGTVDGVDIAGRDHAESHSVASHNDTTGTGAELNTLTDNSMADALHRHSELSASDGAPDQALTVDANGRVNISNDFSVDTDLLFVDIAGNVGVGIGTGTPSEMLDVVGNAEINGDIIVSGTVDGIDIATDVAANTAKDTNVTTNITVVEAPTNVDIQSSDGTNDTIAAADVTNAGVMTTTMYDEHVVNNAKVTYSKTNVKGHIEHGGTAGTGRPSGFTSVEWVGSVEPTNAVNGDTWINTT